MPSSQNSLSASLLDNSQMDLNDDFRKALDLMENTNKNVFITGRAGTGKSTLLEYFRSNTGKNVAVLAPTGVAALNVRGQTIHSFFRLRPDSTPDTVRRLQHPSQREAYLRLDAIVIDEISMVRADLLDCIDSFMRQNGKEPTLPFGGVQMILIGDLYQLPPVVTKGEEAMFKSNYRSQYFFDSNSFESLRVEFMELEKNYRQTDRNFIELLNAIRNNVVKDRHLEMINGRIEDVTSERASADAPSEKKARKITLTTTNRLADEINMRELGKLEGPEHRYVAILDGSFDSSRNSNSLPADEVLNVRVGMQVMLLNNDKIGRWVNGSIGNVVAVSPGLEEDVITIELSNGNQFGVTRHTWEIFKFEYDPKLKRLAPKSAGSFCQYPISPAWAVTIHKSQGKTFDNVVIDIGAGTFAHGQLYVALSRCTTLEGITLKRRVERRHIIMDQRIVDFLTRYQYGQSEQKISLERKVEIIKDAIKNSRGLEIVYLKPNNERSERTIVPSSLGVFEYNGYPYTGMIGMDSKSQGYINLRIERILDIRPIKT